MLSAIEVYRAMTSDAGSGTSTMNIADDDLSVILDALKLAAVHGHQRTIEVRILDDKQIVTIINSLGYGWKCTSVDKAFAELYPEDV